MNYQPQCVSDGLDARDVLRDLRTMQGIYEKRVLPSTAKMYGDAADVIEQLLAAPPQGSPFPEREALAPQRLAVINVLEGYFDRVCREKQWSGLTSQFCADDVIAALTPRAVEKAVERCDCQSPDLCAHEGFCHDKHLREKAATPSGADVRAAALESALKEILSISNGAIYRIAERALSADTRPDGRTGE